MKNTINYFYNLFPDNVITDGEIYYFWVDEDKYYFVPFKNDKEVVLNIYEELLKEKKKVNKIVFNRNNEIITKYKSIDYALIMVDCIENEIVELDNFFYSFVNFKLTDWGSVWEKKIDYLEYQVNQRALGKESILNTFSYYVGLAENAIQYYNFIDKNNLITGIQHKRIYANNYEINYYNPLNMIIDYTVRDIAEYIKFSFFEGDLNLDKTINYIKSLNLSDNMLHLLYARMLFPTYYFDHYEKYINEEETEDELLKIVAKSSEYEKILKIFYNCFFKTDNFFKIEWFFN